MHFAQLRAFHAVAEAGGFTRAAERLGLTQPTLSGQVAALEESYRVRLFERHGREIVLTDLGMSLLGITRQLFHHRQQAEQLLAAARDVVGGQLRVAADSPYHVIALLAAYRRRHPGVRLSVSFANSERVLDDLLARRADIAVLPDVAPDARLHAVPIRRDRLVVFVARGHPWARRRSLAVSELEGCDLVLREPGSATRALFERVMRQAAVQPGSVLEIGSREAVREAVAAGLGIGVVSQGEFGHDERLHSLALRDVPVATVEYAACLASRRPLSALRAFFALLREDETLAVFGTQTVDSGQ